MQSIPRSPHFPIAAVAVAVFAACAALSAGCAANADPAQAKIAAKAPIATKRGAQVFAGISYDPAAPLHVTEKPLFDTANPPKGARTWAVTYAGGGTATVPALYTAPVSLDATKPTRFPCVILLHGLGGKKSDMLLLGVALARRGYASLAIDIAGHGERPPIAGKAVRDFGLAQTHEAVAQTVVDLRRAVDLLSARPDVDPARIGYVGVSLGGIIGATFAGEEPRIKGAVLWAAGGNWGKMITTSHHAYANDQRRIIGPTDAAKIEAALADVDPLRYVGKIAPRPVLFINGDRDEIVPVVCAQELIAAAKEPKKAITLPGGHIPDIGVMLSQTITWLDENVKK